MHNAVVWHNWRGLYAERNDDQVQLYLKIVCQYTDGTAASWKNADLLDLYRARITAGLHELARRTAVELRPSLLDGLARERLVVRELRKRHRKLNIRATLKDVALSIFANVRGSK